MVGIIPAKMAAEIEGDFVVLLLGMRINKFWKVHKWFPVLTGTRNMLKELSANPELGLLGYHLHLGLRSIMAVQYWRSFVHLHGFAGQQSGPHLSAWINFYQKVKFNGDVGIWHETFCVSAGQYESIYGNMPPYGLGQFGKLYVATGRRATAAGRLGQTEGEDTPWEVAEQIGS